MNSNNLLMKITSDDFKKALVGPNTPQWEFVTKQKVYNITHSHDTVGELIYHLKI